MDKNPPEIFVILFHAVIQLLDMSLVQKAQDFFLQLPAPLAGDDFNPFDFTVYRFLDDAVEFGLDFLAAVVNVVQIEFEFCHDYFSPFNNSFTVSSQSNTSPFFSQGPVDFKTLIRPSQQAQKRHLAQLKHVIREYRGSSQAGLIGQLNPLIRGWANYYKTCSAKAIFNHMTTQLYHKLRRRRLFAIRESGQPGVRQLQENNSSMVVVRIAERSEATTKNGTRLRRIIRINTDKKSRSVTIRPIRAIRVP